MQVLALLLSRLVPLLLLFSVCLLLGRFSFERLRDWSPLVAKWAFAGCVLLGIALAVPYVARVSYRLAAEHAYAGSRWSDADRFFARYHDLGGRETEATRFRWALSLMNLRQWKAAEEILLSATRQTSRGLEVPPPIALLIGVCLYYEGRWQQSAEALAREIDPAQLYLRDYFLGRLAERRGDADGAILHYEDCLGRAPSFYPAVYQIVRLRLARRQTDLAREVLTRFLEGEGRRARERLARPLIDAVQGTGPSLDEREFLIVQH